MNIKNLIAAILISIFSTVSFATENDNKLSIISLKKGSGVDGVVYQNRYRLIPRLKFWNPGEIGYGIEASSKRFSSKSWAYLGANADATIPIINLNFGTKLGVVQGLNTNLKGGVLGGNVGMDLLILDKLYLKFTLAEYERMHMTNGETHELLTLGIGQIGVTF